jgi:DNA-binding GntR family transcriptional regulator
LWGRQRRREEDKSQMNEHNMVSQEAQEGTDDSLEGIGPLSKNKSVAEVVYETMKTAIINGDLRPGQRLVEEKISERMHISRAPIREAIKRLEQNGFVTRKSIRGIIVKGVSEADIDEAFGIRAALESYAAVRACERMTDDLVAAFKNSIEATVEALKQGDMKKVKVLNAEFHQMIYKAAQSDMLSSLINTFVDHISRYRKPLLDSERMAMISVEGHREMVEAMRKGDKEDVEKIVKAHILKGKMLILEEIDKGHFE